jgi:hypothetical protein
MNRTIGALIQAQRLLRKGWCQWALARTKNGRSCDAGHKYACEWCLKGSLLASCGVDNEILQRCKQMIFEANGIKNLALANDRPGTEKDDVMLWMSRAIEYAKRHVV